MRISLGLLLTLPLAASCVAQHITVHVIDDGTKMPLKGIYLNLRVDCENPHRPKSLQQKTDAIGTAIFRSVSLSDEPICVDLFSVAYGCSRLQRDFIFISSDKAEGYQKSLTPIISNLPAEVTFHVLKRTFGDRLRFLFQGP